MTDVDLSGDGGVIKRILRHAKPDSPIPSDATPIADGLFSSSAGGFVGHIIFRGSGIDAEY